MVGTAYGWVLLTKTGLFVALLALAALNHFRFAPALARQRTRSAAMALTCSIASEIAVGLLVVLAAAVLSSLEPGMHAHVVTVGSHFLPGYVAEIAA